LCRDTAKQVLAAVHFGLIPSLVPQAALRLNAIFGQAGAWSWVSGN
jgi:hypothetical protein